MIHVRVEHEPQQSQRARIFTFPFRLESNESELSIFPAHLLEGERNFPHTHTRRARMNGKWKIAEAQCRYCQATGMIHCDDDCVFYFSLTFVIWMMFDGKYAGKWWSRPWNITVQRGWRLRLWLRLLWSINECDLFSRKCRPADVCFSRIEKLLFPKNEWI